MDAASQALFFKTSYNIWSILLFLGFCLARLDITCHILPNYPSIMKQCRIQPRSFLIQVPVDDNASVSGMHDAILCDVGPGNFIRGMSSLQEMY